MSWLKLSFALAPGSRTPVRHRSKRLHLQGHAAATRVGTARAAARRGIDADRVHERQCAVALRDARDRVPLPFPRAERESPDVLRVAQRLAQTRMHPAVALPSARPRRRDAFVVQFTNEARRGESNVGGLVRAQLVYRDGVRELRRITRV